MTAFGFVELADLYSTRLANVPGGGVQRVYDAVRTSAREYSNAMNSALAEFAERTIMALEQFELPGDGTLQPLDANGNPIPVKPSGSYQVAYPIQGGGTAWGTNRVSRELMTVEEAARNTDDATMRDSDWMIRHMMAAILDNAEWTFVDEIGPNGAKGLGDIVVKPLANGDAVTYIRKGATAPATDSHYLAQAAAISDAANPFAAIKAELHEHPSNMNGRVLCYVATSLVASIKALSNFVPVDDPDILTGDNTDRVSNIPSVGPGDEVIGKVDGCWIIEWGRLPAGYMIAKIAGKKVLKQREYPTASLQGFFPENASPDGNHIVTRMLRYAGFGVADRVGAVAYYVGGADYVVPTGFDAPLAV